MIASGHACGTTFFPANIIAKYKFGFINNFPAKSVSILNLIKCESYGRSLKLLTQVEPLNSAHHWDRLIVLYMEVSSIMRFLVKLY